MMHVEDPKATAATFLIIALFSFVAIFFILPFYWVALAFLAIGIIYSLILFKQSRTENKNEKKLLAAVVMIAALLSFTFAVQSSRGLSLFPLIIDDILTIIQATGMITAIVLYTRWMYITIIYVAVYIFSIPLAIISGSARMYKVTKNFGYLFFFIMIFANIIEIFMMMGNLDLVIPLLGISMPYEMWYTIEIGSWLVAGWTFITNILTELVTSATAEPKTEED